jgi:hypothetical protein
MGGALVDGKAKICDARSLGGGCRVDSATYAILAGEIADPQRLEARGLVFLTQLVG